jgi:hypothetical protein
MDGQDETAEREIARLGTRAKGVVTRWELLQAGLSPTQIDRRIRIGGLIPEFRGVYRAGHAAPSLEARYMAAVKACGEGALLSGRAAAFLLGLLKGPAPPPEVTAPKVRRVKGLKTKHSRGLQARDGTLWRGIPVTTVPATLLALAARLSPEDLARAFHEAGIRHHTKPDHVEEALQRRPNTPGARALREVMRGDVHVTLSHLERRFLSLIAAVGLDLPETNRKSGSHYVDCRWPAARLTVELDSYRYHRSRHAWEQDRHREREARARGDHFRRYTWTDVFEDTNAMLRELRRLTARP